MTHLHEDHWDEAAARVVPKDKPIYVQNDRDAQVLREQGFTQLTVLTQNTALGDLTLRKTGGQHGSIALTPSRKWLSVWVMPAELSSSIRRKNAVSGRGHHLARRGGNQHADFPAGAWSF